MLSSLTPPFLILTRQARISSSLNASHRESSSISNHNELSLSFASTISSTHIRQIPWLAHSVHTVRLVLGFLIRQMTKQTRSWFSSLLSLVFMNTNLLVIAGSPAYARDETRKVVACCRFVLGRHSRTVCLDPWTSVRLSDLIRVALR